MKNNDIYNIFIDRMRIAAFNRNLSVWYDNLSVITQIQDLTTKNGFINIKDYLLFSLKCYVGYVTWFCSFNLRSLHVVQRRC